ncbi:MAG TPA: alpha/beta hydrolase [Gemmatimonadaceae bacterium]|nr:alpha/beta hydrolase [Gemmatimonadaceae bacterium]
MTVDVYGDPDGPSIVLIPGVLSDANAWGAAARRLSGWETVAVVNRRGRRPSGPLTDTYDLVAEVEDATAVLGEFAEVRTVFGWSYGGLIALHLANTVAVPHVIAYEPVIVPFGASALPGLRQARDNADSDASVEVALRQAAGMRDNGIASLRSDDELWAELRRLSAPVYAETLAINEALQPEQLAVEAERVDLIVGELNREGTLYGKSFDDVARRVPAAVVHELSGQGHLAHLEAPEQLAALVTSLQVPASD